MSNDPFQEFYGKRSRPDLDQSLLDYYFIQRLDQKLGQSKINEPQIKKYAGRAGIPNKTINSYLSNRQSFHNKIVVTGWYASLVDKELKKSNFLSLERVIYRG